MIRITRYPTADELVSAVERCKATDAARCKATDAALDQDNDFAHGTLAADRHARAELLELVSRLRQRRRDDCAAVMPDGTIVAVAHQGDGLVIASPGSTPAANGHPELEPDVTKKPPRKGRKRKEDAA